jgi:hypothetical protein
MKRTMKTRIAALATVIAIVCLLLVFSLVELRFYWTGLLIWVSIFPMIAIAIVAAFYAEKKNILLIASLIVFALEFLILWIPATVDAFDFEHLIAALQGNPMAISNSYVQGLVSSAFWFGIFPTAAGIGLFIISFVQRGRLSVDGFGMCFCSLVALMVSFLGPIT